MNVYVPHLIHMIALALLWRRLGNLAWLMFASMVCSWIVGYRLGGIDRIVAMVMLDLSLILAVRALYSGARARIVAAVSLCLILVRAAYMGGSYIPHPIYAATINSAFVLQLLIGGGMADVIGVWIDSRLARVWPWGARALRHVAV